MMMELGAKDWDAGLEFACEGGHRDLALFMIKQGAHVWAHGLYGACKGGHKELVLLIIKQGVKLKDLNWGLYGACQEGNIELALFMIDNGADDFNFGLIQARIGKHNDLILILNEKLNKRVIFRKNANIL